MVEPNFSWIYLIIFLAIPLSRIIPRLIAKRKMQNNSSQKREFESNFDPYKRPQMEYKPEIKDQKNLSKDKMVLRELNLGNKTFDGIQKNTGLNGKDLDSILEDLEKKGLMKVVHKQGLFGPKIELYLTDNGFKEYFS
ncbi:hypothetical protein NsoK4_00900 [Nitrosopumilus sp. K4]|uniref:hypothetical protein n=1 Tax=Nitrosopumilus sp. K4 TaxID=2795383 RepID=UPI001BACE702|nr:hypothetical protein [Nitrosopumilus sp. K4]QUC64874.1 hypothetical protein NsoK4_00900 [Nitrosopumilus sp. K4]